MRSAGLPLTIGYTSHLWDRALGQYFAPFRYYNPATARWNMRDPLGFVDGPNVYAYVAGNPVMNIDPTGGSLGNFMWCMLGLDPDELGEYDWRKVPWEPLAPFAPWITANKLVKNHDWVTRQAKRVRPLVRKISKKIAFKAIRKGVITFVPVIGQTITVAWLAYDAFKCRKHI